MLPQQNYRLSETHTIVDACPILNVRCHTHLAPNDQHSRLHRTCSLLKVQPLCHIVRRLSAHSPMTGFYVFPNFSLLSRPSARSLWGAISPVREVCFAEAAALSCFTLEMACCYSGYQIVVSRQFGVFSCT